jgi:hypothetical protein
VGLVHFTKVAHVRFELAGIKMDRVVPGIIPRKAGRDVGLDNVVFYLNGERIPPPWAWADAPREWTDAWNEYRAHLVKKHPMPEKAKT